MYIQDLKTYAFKSPKWQKLSEKKKESSKTCCQVFKRTSVMQTHWLCGHGAALLLQFIDCSQGRAGLTWQEEGLKAHYHAVNSALLSFLHCAVKTKHQLLTSWCIQGHSL